MEVVVYDVVPEVLSELIRNALIPKPGHQVLVADFSAIEARIIAWLAGETWRNDVFASHGRIYEASAKESIMARTMRNRKKSPIWKGWRKSCARKEIEKRSFGTPVFVHNSDIRLINVNDDMDVDFTAKAKPLDEDHAYWVPVSIILFLSTKS